MYRGHTVGVVIPAYNEEGKVGRVVETLPSYIDRGYVVDDGSTDGTWAEIVSATESYNTDRSPIPAFDERVLPVRHEENRGVGAAIQTGYRHALADGVDVTAVMGGDGQMDPAVLPTLLDPIIDRQADYTKGNRFLAPDDLHAMPRFRFVGNWLLSVLTKVASGYWGVSDPQNGYTAISIEALEAIDLDEMFGYYGYCNDLLVRLNVAGMRVADVAHSATSVYDMEEWDSHIDYTSYIPRVSWLLVRIFLWRLECLSRRQQAHPVVFCYFLGVGLAILSLLAAVIGDVLVWAPILALGATLVVAGAHLDRRQNRDQAVRIYGGMSATATDPSLNTDGASTDYE